MLHRRTKTSVIADCAFSAATTNRSNPLCRVDSPRKSLRKTRFTRPRWGCCINQTGASLDSGPSLKTAVIHKVQNFLTPWNDRCD